MQKKRKKKKKKIISRWKSKKTRKKERNNKMKNEKKNIQKLQIRLKKRNPLHSLNLSKTQSTSMKITSPLQIIH
jgi:hypothetical protein